MRTVASNPQLKVPTGLPKNRKAFFNGYAKGKNFNFLVMQYCTKKWFRQFVKRQLIRVKIVGGGKKTYSISFTEKR